MGLNSVLFELIVCAYLHVKSFELASVMNFFGEAISSVDSRFAFEVMSADCSVDRNFRSVFMS